jgi:two-component system chemotaxis response regulator CheB
MDKIRVFLVDDSAVVRRLVKSALNQDPELEVVGMATDGKMALNRLVDDHPDIVLLDLEMPVLSGLETLVALRKTHPRLPVIMFSRFTQRGVEATVQALTLGADDYVPKPSNVDEVGPCIETVLIPKIKLLGQRSKVPSRVPGPVSEAAPSAPWTLSSGSISGRRPRVEIVVIGASTGGPSALAELMHAFPPTWPVPLVIVQHMPPEFTTWLAARLAEKSGLCVHEAVGGERVADAHAWVAPGNHHLLLQQDGKGVRLALNQDPPVNSCRPSVDVLFRSASQVYGAGVLAVVLTGMGQDGLLGCECVRKAGGQVLVQDEASSVVWSMPGAVARAGLADQVLALEHLGPQIMQRAQRRSSPSTQQL